jgi:aerobic-type carbon monoxide dehydrogenase small subunit (CoxS/CutS family)
MSIRLTVNNQVFSIEVDARITLAECLRNRLRLTGTHIGCAHGVCGACTVIFDGSAVRSCLMLAVQADGGQIETIEGLSVGDELNPLQRAFRKHHALQCGFCTAGMVMTLHSFLTCEPYAGVDRIREILGGNLCRCTGYVGIIDAALEAQGSYQDLVSEEARCEAQ